MLSPNMSLDSKEIRYVGVELEREFNVGNRKIDELASRLRGTPFHSPGGRSIILPLCFLVDDEIRRTVESAIRRPEVPATYLTRYFNEITFRGSSLFMLPSSVVDDFLRQFSRYNPNYHRDRSRYYERPEHIPALASSHAAAFFGLPAYKETDMLPDIVAEAKRGKKEKVEEDKLDPELFKVKLVNLNQNE